MVNNEIKAHCKTKNKNKGYAIRLDPEQSEILRYLSDQSGRSQINILKSILDSMMSVAITYRTFTFDVMPDRNTCLICFYGHGSTMVVGKLTEELSDSEIDAKVLARVEQNRKTNSKVS